MPIPLNIRDKMSSDGSMLHCIHRNSDCSGRVEWEHAWIYAGKKIQEEWAIVPCCTYHHRGAGLDKDFNRYCSLVKARYIASLGVDVFCKYPKKNWRQEWEFLKTKYKQYER